MKIRANRDTLIDALSDVMPAVARRTTLPALECVLLSSEDGQVRLSATNLTQYVRINVAADAERDGAMAVPARLLSETIGAMPAGDVRLDGNLETHKLKIEGQGSKATILCIDEGEFPLAFDDPEDAQSVELSSDELSLLADYTTYAAAGDESRPVLTGVNIARTDGMVAWSAADGYRLGFVTQEEEQRRSDKSFDVIVPSESLETAAKFAGHSAAPVIMRITDQRVSWAWDDRCLWSQLIEGQFPDVRQVIPSEHKTRIVIERKSLMDAVKTAMVFARDAANLVKLEGVENLSVTGESGDHGDALTVLDVESWEGSSLEIAMNGRYLFDALSALVGATVTVDVQDKSHPIVLKDDRAIAVVMPMSIS